MAFFQVSGEKGNPQEPVFARVSQMTPKRPARKGLPFHSETDAKMQPAGYAQKYISQRLKFIHQLVVSI
jgi:hypothetical protein